MQGTKSQQNKWGPPPTVHVANNKSDADHVVRWPSLNGVEPRQRIRISFMSSRFHVEDTSPTEGGRGGKRKYPVRTKEARNRWSEWGYIYTTESFCSLTDQHLAEPTTTAFGPEVPLRCCFLTPCTVSALSSIPTLSHFYLYTPPLPFPILFFYLIFFLI